ncbi:MAG: MFS transporter [Acidobacteria bacterium]|nr:MFS transporter [Acidobacteriota bacterium]
MRLEPTSRNGWIVVVAAAATSAVGTFDLTGVNVVLPHMASELRVDAALIQWVSLGYLLPIAALALPAGRWLDTVGRRPAMLLLVAGFATSSALAGLAPDLPLLVAIRAVQGVFGAGLFAVTPIMAYQALRPAERLRGIGVVSATAAAGGVAGPAIGALVTQALGWPWIFWLTLPLLVAQLPVLARMLPRDLPLRPPKATLLLEGLMIGGATTLVLLALTLTAGGSPSWLLLALGALPLAGLWRRLHPDAPMLILLRHPGFGVAAGSLALLAACVLSAQYLLAFVAARSMHLSTGATGAALLALPAATVVAAVTAARLPVGVPPARVSALGFVVIAAGASAALSVTHFVGLVLAALTIGIGQGLANMPATHFAMDLAGDAAPASTGATMSLLRNLGTTIGPACVSAVWGALGFTATGMSFALLIAGAFALAGAALILLAGRAGARAPATASAPAA